MDKRMHVNVSRANDDKDEKIGYLEYDRVDSLLTRMMLMCMLCCKQKQIIRNTSSLNYTDSLFETPISIKEGASLAKFRLRGFRPVCLPKMERICFCLPKMERICFAGLLKGGHLQNL
eukprot:scaffold26629_cov143-Skeletonema_menzelii.AAC.4